MTGELETWLVQQLREWPKRAHPDRTASPTYIMPQAADLIERQAAEIERLQTALENIANIYPGWTSERIAVIRTRARKALENNNAS